MLNLHRELLIVFHPYVKPGTKRPFRYKAVSVNRMHEYIPVERLEKEVNKMFDLGLEKHTFYVKLCGWVYMYRK